MAVHQEGAENQDCCAVTSLLVGTDMERMRNCVLGHNSAAGGYWHHPACLVMAPTVGFEQGLLTTKAGAGCAMCWRAGLSLKQ